MVAVTGVRFPDWTSFILLVFCSAIKRCHVQVRYISHFISEQFSKRVDMLAIMMLLDISFFFVLSFRYATRTRSDSTSDLRHTVIGGARYSNH